MKKILLILLLCYYSNFTGAQSNISMSPDAMGIAKLTGVPVSYYTGTMAINLSLVELSGLDLATQVSLSYNASGHKVQEIASSVGLGWSLNAGGLITRVVRGKADDLNDGYCKSTVDTEPDLYFYNFQGQSGKFFLDKFGVAITIPYRDIKIKPGICVSGSSGIWEITDESGIKYVFGKSTYYDREVTTVRQNTNHSNTQTYTSAWMLSEVITPSGHDKISFSYTNAFITTNNTYFTLTKDPCNNNIVHDLSSTVTTNSKYISSITSAKGSIYFSYTFNKRKDLSGGVSLSSVTLNNKEGRIKTFKFKYVYFQSDGCSTIECFRLKLDAIYDLGAEPLYSFSYNTTVNLPARNSKNFDHWGYYNANTVNSWFPEVLTKSYGSFYTHYPNATLNFQTYTGASREPDAIRSLANILTGIAERSGSKQEFRYEAHRSGKTGSNVLVGGARIKEISVEDEKGNIYKRLIKYESETNASLSSGHLFKESKYMFGLYDNNGNVTKFRRLSHPHNNLYDLNGGFIGYSKVEEVIPGQGSTVYSYTNHDTNPDYKDPATGAVSDYSWQRGLLFRQRGYDRFGNILSEQTTGYNFNAPNKRSVGFSDRTYWNWSCSCGFLCNDTGAFEFKYKHIGISRVLSVSNLTNIRYDPLDNLKRMTQVRNLFYNENGYLVKTEEYDLNRPTVKYVSETKYPTDPSYYNNSFCENQRAACVQNCPGSSDPTECEIDCYYAYEACSPPASGETSALHMLKEKHIMVPIEQNSWIEKDNVRIFKGAVIKTFTIVGGGFVAPKNILQLSKVVTSYTPSYVDESGEFIIAPGFKTVSSFTFNSSTGRLVSETGFSGITKNYTYSQDNTALLQTQENSGGNVQSEQYTSKLLVGPTSITDLNGRVSYTEYDPLNRPKLRKDHEGNILTRYRYQYKGEKPNLALAVSNLMALTNQSISFSVSDILVTAGTTYLKWNMGDGTTYQDNRTSAYKSYINPGTYNVTVTMENTAYENTVKSVPIAVYNPMVLESCIDGPVWKDNCSANPAVYGTCTTTQDPYGATLKVTTTATDTGCPGYQYYWEYKPVNGGWWTYLGNTPEMQFYYDGEYQIRCTVTDGCGDQQIIDDMYINYQCGF